MQAVATRGVLDETAVTGKRGELAHLRFALGPQ